MNILRMIAAGAAIFFAAVSPSIGQALQPLNPIVVRIGDIDRDSVVVLKDRVVREGQTLGALVAFLFEDKSEAEVGVLVQEGIRSKRPVQILDGPQLIAECRIRGQGRSATKHGLLVTFDSINAAEQAAHAMKKSKKTEPQDDLDTMLERMTSDRRSWRL